MTKGETFHILFEIFRLINTNRNLTDHAKGSLRLHNEWKGKIEAVAEAARRTGAARICSCHPP